MYFNYAEFPSHLEGYLDGKRNSATSLDLVANQEASPDFVDSNTTIEEIILMVLKVKGLAICFAISLVDKITHH